MRPCLMLINSLKNLRDNGVQMQARLPKVPRPSCLPCSLHPGMHLPLRPSPSLFISDLLCQSPLSPTLHPGMARALPVAGESRLPVPVSANRWSSRVTPVTHHHLIPESWCTVAWVWPGALAVACSSQARSFPRYSPNCPRVDRCGGVHLGTLVNTNVTLKPASAT